MSETILDTFGKLMNWNAFSYRGCIVTRSGSGYMVGKTWCKDKEAVDSEINKRLLIIQNSLTNIKPSNHATPKE
jgi:hypothetical protein